MTSREENVLAARDPSLENENDWQEFNLTDVKVLIPGKVRYANLLTAGPNNPLCVIGCLDEVEEKQEVLVLDKDYLSKRMVIDNVTHYAYGQNDDGEVGIWVAGQAGWFAISPAKGYRLVYNDMVEAIDLLYFLVDRHQRKRQSRRIGNPSFEYLCDKYVGHTHGICEDGDDSAEVFYKHHGFLLLQMVRGREDVHWPETSIFKRLCEKYPDEYEDLKASHELPTDVTTMNGNKEADSQSADWVTVAKAQGEAIYDVILSLKQAGALTKRQLNIDLIAATIQSRYEIDSVEYARDLIAARASMLIEMMDEAKTSSFDWSRKAIYRELKAVTMIDHRQNIDIMPLRRRALEEDESSDHQSGREDHPRVRKRRARMSLLRPKLSSVSAKKAGKQIRNMGEDDTSEESEPAPEPQTPSKVHGHEFVRVPPSANVRENVQSLLPDTGSISLRKTPLQETQQTGNLSSLTLRDEADMERLGADSLPGDTWKCSVQGCDKIVTRASSKRSKQLISDHSLAHAEDTQTKLDLVFAEHRLNINIGIDHLVSRIRQTGTLEGVAADGSTGDYSPKRMRRW